jgi:hypothetical protein
MAATVAGWPTPHAGVVCSVTMSVAAPFHRDRFRGGHNDQTKVKLEDGMAVVGPGVKMEIGDGVLKMRAPMPALATPTPPPALAKPPPAPTPPSPSIGAFCAHGLPSITNLASFSAASHGKKRLSFDASSTTPVKKRARDTAVDTSRTEAAEELAALKESAAKEIAALKGSAAKELSALTDLCIRVSSADAISAAKELAALKESAAKELAALKGSAAKEIAALKESAAKELAALKESAAKTLGVKDELIRDLHARAWYYLNLSTSQYQAIGQLHMDAVLSSSRALAIAAPPK